jgi:hypothetical protein
MGGALSPLIMRKVFIAVLLCIVGTAGTASADRYRRDNRDRVIIRDNRNNNRVVTRDHRYDNRTVVRTQPRYERPRYVRRPVYVSNNQYTFHDGRTFHYRRPVINYRYTNYRVRPTILVENYNNVPGYVWVAGNWNWNGYEWIWVSGHYEVDNSYVEPSYYQSGYQGGYYDNSSYDPGCDH